MQKKIEFRQEWYTKGKNFDGGGIQKDGFGTGMAYKRKDFGREWYGKDGF